MATAPKDSKKDATFKCVANHMFNGKTDTREFSVIMKAAGS